MTIFENEAFPLIHCSYKQSWATAYLVSTHSTSYYLTIILFVIGAWKHELYLVLVGFGLTFSALVNVLLKMLFQQAVANGMCGSYYSWCVDPRIVGATCDVGVWPWSSPTPGSHCVPCAMPSFEVQQTMFVVCTAYIYMMQFRSPLVRTSLSILLETWLMVTCYTHVFIGYNTPYQALAGAFVGALLGTLWQLLIFAYVYPNVNHILNWRLVQYAGPYYNNFLVNEVPGYKDPVILVDDDDVKNA